MTPTRNDFTSSYNTRNEETQARYLKELINFYQAAGVHGCFVYTFFSPGFPHNSNPMLDLDMAGFGLVKMKAGSEKWEPKVAFHEVAERYLRLPE